MFTAIAMDKKITKFIFWIKTTVPNRTSVWIKTHIDDGMKILGLLIFVVGYLTLASTSPPGYLKKMVKVKA